jgi:hypothetical protein
LVLCFQIQQSSPDIHVWNLRLIFPLLHESVCLFQFTLAKLCFWKVACKSNFYNSDNIFPLFHIICSGVIYLHLWLIFNWQPLLTL